MPGFSIPHLLPLNNGTKVPIVLEYFKDGTKLGYNFSMNYPSRPPRVLLETLGCKYNQAESEDMTRDLTAAGYQMAEPSEACDIYVLNTCSVTHVADRKCRQHLRGARQRHTAAFIVAVGCAAHTMTDELQTAGAVLVLDNTQKSDLVGVLKNAGFSPDSCAPGTPNTRVRSMIAVQNGCGRHCAYCVVPLVRGKESSRSPADVIQIVEKRLAAGYREVTLTGTEVGSYRFGEIDLAGLVKRVLDETAIERLRISSLQPQELSPSLLDSWRDPRLCPHFHLALQSGSDEVLKHMGRAYDTVAYSDSLKAIRRLLPQAAITTDIIVGFPGETGAEFEESLDFVRAAGFARLHVFAYSKRKSTPAADMPGQVEETEKKRRSRLMLAQGKASAREFQHRMLGQPVEVLWESITEACESCGYSGNYVRVYGPFAECPPNSITRVIPQRIYRDGLWANSQE